MNTRIKELAKLSDCTIDGLGYGEGNIEKFAQLIIKEVISEFYDEIQYNFSSGYAKEITDVVKRRFGVE